MAVAELGRESGRVLATVPHEGKAVRKVLEKLGLRETVSGCYEAGPTGYGLARALRAAPWACEVIAPSLIPKKSGQRIKIDRRDALKLAQNHRAGELVAVFVPDERTEAIRDLERAREDAKKAERVVRHPLSKFLLRHGRVSTGKTSWNAAHRAWIAQPVATRLRLSLVRSLTVSGRAWLPLGGSRRPCPAGSRCWVPVRLGRPGRKRH
jgi:transposase